MATAAHVGNGIFNLGGYSYSAVGGSLVTFSPTGTATYQPDLVLFRINAGAGDSQTYLDSLQRMALTTTGLAAGTDVRLIGHGDGNDSAVIKTWGDNEISGALSFTIGSNELYGGIGYYTLNANGVAAITGDSGGGMFHLIDEDHWALAGIIVANGNINGEGPGSAIISLEAYADQILAIIPEPTTLAAISALLAFASVAVARRRT